MYMFTWNIGEYQLSGNLQWNMEPKLGERGGVPQHVWFSYHFKANTIDECFFNITDFLNLIKCKLISKIQFLRTRSLCDL